MQSSRGTGITSTWAPAPGLGKVMMKALLKDYKDRIIPLLFSISITWWVLESFMGKYSVLEVVVIFIFQSIVFIGMIQAGKSKLGLILFSLGTLLFFAAIIATNYNARESYGTSYLIWLAMLDQYSRSIVPYELSTVFLVCYMFPAIVFYFSCIRDRIGILFMTGCIPLILHTAKTDGEITLPVIIFIGLFFCLYIGKNRSLITNNPGSHSKRWFLAAVLCFVSIILILSLLLPKPLVSPKLAELDSVVFQVIRPLINTANNESALQNDTYSLETSHAPLKLDSASLPNSDRVLFRVDANEPLYMRVQSRDSYVRNRWITSTGRLTEGYPVEHLRRRHLKLIALTEIFGKMEKQDLLALGFHAPEDILTLPSHPQAFAEAAVSTNRVDTDCYIHPPGTYSVEGEIMDPEIYCNDLGFIYPTDGKNLIIIDRTHLAYVSQNLTPASREMAIVRQMNADVYRNFSKSRQALYEKVEPDLKDSSLSESELMAIFFEADQEFQTACEYFTDLPGDLPDRIYQLAASITSDETSDYGKAVALENFFHSAGFRYDSTPPRLPYGMDINDYFLFESKRGFCVHFASAMVILARACGLPARYTEGYVCDEWNEQIGAYWIRVNDAHAFPEIYIAGVGWMVFEPTVSSESESSFAAFFNRAASQFRSFAQSISRMLQALPVPVKLSFIPFIVTGAFYLLWLLTCLRYRAWLKRTMKADGSHALKRIFIRLVTLLKNIKIEMKKSDTPSGFAARVLNEKGINITPLTDVYNRTIYGGHSLSPEDLQEFLMLYQNTAVCVKALIRGPKAWFIR